MCSEDKDSFKQVYNGVFSSFKIGTKARQISEMFLGILTLATEMEGRQGGREGGRN